MSPLKSWRVVISHKHTNPASVLPILFYKSRSDLNQHSAAWPTVNHWMGCLKLENVSPPTWLSFYRIVVIFLKIASWGLDEDCFGFKGQLEEDYSLTSTKSTTHGHWMVFTYLGPPLLQLYFLVVCVQIRHTILLLNIPLRLFTLFSAIVSEIISSQGSSWFPCIALAFCSIHASFVSSNAEGKGESDFPVQACGFCK